ncbi:MAG: hypothetical protein JWS12_145 [Candidatus Saccharibacteria bacterium]|nr:hypothetical protein [Candidatus Saccharibacteria bacterium]
MADEPKKVFDVSSPGKAKPDATSRPIIVSRPIVKDPMMAPEAPTPAADMVPTKAMAEKPESDEPGIKKVGITIKPSSATIEAVKDSQTTESTTPEEVIPTAEPVVAEDQATIAPEMPEAQTPPEQPVEKPTPVETTETSGLADETEASIATEQASKTKDQEKVDAQDAARQEVGQKLVAGKQYFVPIGQISRKRTRMLVILLILLLLVVVGGYLAVDGGLIKTSLKLPLDLIKN